MDYKRGSTFYDYCIKEDLEIKLSQFDYNKNFPKKPHDFTKFSAKKIWFWYQECGHS